LSVNKEEKDVKEEGGRNLNRINGQRSKNNLFDLHIREGEAFAHAIPKERTGHPTHKEKKTKKL